MVGTSSCFRRKAVATGKINMNKQRTCHHGSTNARSVARPFLSLQVFSFLMIITNYLLASAQENGVPRLCVGVRGNGQFIFSHFGALARIVETLGPIGAMSGGSSGTISMFLTESIHSNPLVMGQKNTTINSSIYDADESNRNQTIARISFLIKSTEGIVEAGLGYLLSPWEIMDTFYKAVVSSDFSSILDSNETDAEEVAATYLDTFLKDYDTDLINAFRDAGLFFSSLPSVINPEIQEILATSPYRIQKLKDILMNTNINFDASDTNIFIRPTLVNWNALSALLDVIGSFYIGYEPVNLMDMDFMLSQCAERSLGLQWPEISVLSTESGENCGTLFKNTFFAYLDSRKVYSEDAPPPSRVNDPIGTDVFWSVAQTSGLIEEGINTFREARNEYISGNWNPDFDVDFDTVAFGYWGNDTPLKIIEQNLGEMHQDLKSTKFYSLGPATWSQALVRSPAEPGLSRAVETGPEFISVGGWADLTPAQILDATGNCEKIVLVNHPFQSPFGMNVAALLGATQEEMDLLYDISDPSSSWTQALMVADANLCYDYKLDAALSPRDLFQGSWNAPLTTTQPSIRSLFPEDNPSALLEYCSPGYVADEDTMFSFAPSKEETEAATATTSTGFQESEISIAPAGTPKSGVGSSSPFLEPCVWIWTIVCCSIASSLL